MQFGDDGVCKQMSKWEAPMFVVLGVHVRVLNINDVCFDKSEYLLMVM